jgi:hypothetical protein
MTGGLTAHLVAGALMRLAQVQGGFAAVMAKGDPNAGQLLLMILEKGQFFGLFERQLAGDSRYSWQACGPQDVENAMEITAYQERRRARDPDLWVIELDVPVATQLIAELSAIG